MPLLEKLRKMLENRDIKLVTTERRRNHLISENVWVLVWLCKLEKNKINIDSLKNS